MALAHLAAASASGASTHCRAWLVRRRDGQVLGFTDHDLDLEFDGIVFRADSGLTAQALQQTTGLAVDNTEALGALRAEAITEADLVAGHFDGAEVEAWLVDWSDPSNRVQQFRGVLGEVQTGGGAFQAELRGLTDALNQPIGRSYQRFCSVRLGDADCGIDVDDPAFRVDATVTEAINPATLRVTDGGAHGDRWFERGMLEVLTGAGAGLTGVIKADDRAGAGRTLSLWQDLRAPLAAGDLVRLRAGCEKTEEACKEKFGNLINFRGFPHIPGEDWLMAHPTRSGDSGGGSRTR